MLIFRKLLLSFSPFVNVAFLLKMPCAARYCYIAQTGDSEVTHSIFCTIEYDRAQNGMCGCAKRQRLTGGEQAADKEGRRVVWSYLPLLMQMTNVKAKGFVLWKPPVTHHCIRAIHSDWLGEVTAGANILVCAKAYRRDSIMPELMSCTVFVLGVNEG